MASQILHIDIATDCDRWPDEVILHELSKRCVLATAKSAQLAWPEGAELSLLFSDDARVQELNEQWRGKDKPTNVLSFPADDIVPGQASGQMIGDLVFAFQTLEREACEQDKSFEDHLAHLMVHGFLHLFGYDHITDEQAKQMESLERKVMASLNIANPYEEIV